MPNMNKNKKKIMMNGLIRSSKIFARALVYSSCFVEPADYTKFQKLLYPSKFVRVALGVFFLTQLGDPGSNKIKNRNVYRVVFFYFFAIPNSDAFPRTNIRVYKDV